MTLDPKEAAASLDDVAAIERRTWETLVYAGSSTIFILWGVVTLVANLVNWLIPAYVAITWIVADVAGIAGSFAIVFWQNPRTKSRQTLMRRWIGTYLAFFLYGGILVTELAPLTARQQQVFWPTLVLFGYVLMGIWVGKFFLWIGLIATALIVAGYFSLGPWFLPWMALVLGAGMIGAGLWLRRPA